MTIFLDKIQSIIGFSYFEELWDTQLRQLWSLIKIQSYIWGIECRLKRFGGEHTEITKVNIKVNHTVLPRTDF